MLTLVSPLLNLVSSHFAGRAPSRSQIAAVNAGCELPEKICTRLMVVDVVASGFDGLYRLLLFLWRIHCALRSTV